MTVRDTLIAALRAWADRYDGEIAPGTPEQMADAYRAEVLAEAKTETVAWLVKKAAEQKTWDAGVLASKVDRGAVRIFLGTGRYWDAMEAHRAEVLRDLLERLEQAAGESAVEQLLTHNPDLAQATAPEEGVRTRVLTQSFTGQPPHLTIRLTYGPEYTDAGISEITERVRAAAQHGFKPITEDGGR